MAESGEKTHDPTPRRRQQARASGHVAQSQELVSATLLLAGLGLLIFAGGSLIEFLAKFLARRLGDNPWLSVDADFVTTQWRELVGGLASVLMPVLGLLLLVAVGLNLLQTGFLFLPNRVLPDVGRLDPIAGLSRMFSLSSIVRLSLGVAKVAAVVAVAWLSWYSRREELLNLSQFELPQIAATLWRFSVGTCLKMGAALLVLAVLDYLYQRWKYERDLRMTPQELRDEMQELEGRARVNYARGVGR